MGTQARRNLELKTRLPELASIRAVVRDLCGNSGQIEFQTDTYFHVPNGRLKLREIQGREAMLIWYRRPNEAETRTSDYYLVPVTAPEIMASALTGALGVRGVVKKRREIFLWHNVRIHLDEVDRLGTFLEFEAVIGPEDDEAISRNRLDELIARLSLQPQQYIATSYVDLLGI